MHRDYTASFLGYIVGGALLLFGIFFGIPFFIIGIIKHFNKEINLTTVNLYGSIILIILFLTPLISDTFLTLIFAPFISYWHICVREDGLYGNYYWERLLLKKPRKLCEWSDIEKVRQYGLLNLAIFRTVVILKNKKKFAITNISNTPRDMMNLYKAKDRAERTIKYSNAMFYALIMKRIGINKFENFKGNYWNYIMMAYDYADLIIEEDRKMLEKRKQWVKEDSEATSRAILK